MTTTKTTYDVFVSSSSDDKELAREIADKLRNDGLQPFHDDDLPASANFSTQIWNALAESRALIAIISTASSQDAMGMVEIGAATAWNKPIFLILNGPPSTPIPKALSTYQVFPRNRLDEVLHKIRTSFEPLTDEDRELLSTVYKTVGVSADHLVQNPKSLRQLVSKFNNKAKKTFSGERVLSELLRLRKRGHLPRISKRVT